MNFAARRMLLLLILLTSPTFLKAQVVPAGVGPGAYIGVGAGVSSFQSVYGQRDLVGGLLYVDVHPQWRIGFEGEARFLSFHTSEQVSETNYMGGMHVLLLNRHHFEPYVKFLAGMGKITLPFNYAHGSFLAYAPGGGLDFAICHNVTLRVIDFEYQHWPQFPFGALSPYGFSTGIRVRITPTPFIPKRTRWRRVRFPALPHHNGPYAD